MKIVDLDDAALRVHVAEMAADIVEKENIDIVIGIRRGGAYVGHLLWEAMGAKGSHAKYFELTCQRSSTSVKGFGVVKFVIKMLPRVVNDLLRKLEHRLVSLTVGLGSNGKRRVEGLDGDLLKSLEAGTENTRILLVDDAIDSGSTMETVIDALRSVNEAVVIRTCALTVTQRDARVRPDYSVYDEVLLRCSWAADGGTA